MEGWREPGLMALEVFTKEFILLVFGFLRGGAMRAVSVVTSPQ